MKLCRRGRTPQREFPADGDFIAYHSSTIDTLLMFAYKGASPGHFTISGEPDWVKNDLYDFTAKVAPEDVAEWRHMQLTDQRYMVQRALEEALKMKTHDDTSHHPVYQLQVAKGGPKLMDYHAGDTVTPANGPAQSGHVLGWLRSVQPGGPGLDHGRPGGFAELARAERDGW